MSTFLTKLGVGVDPSSYGISEADWGDRIRQALDGARGRNFVAPCARDCAAPQAPSTRLLNVGAASE
ncbi:hypothetical protein [Variovorax sp. Root473]|uniref:hypothetical protein n=1 Tax=Variovorax sp. Root473 TaxID=1736541 RepID=UPI00138F5C45|nr:hypothetical protein [Variovorax sp. Root473]